MTTTFSPGFARGLLDLDGVAIIQQLRNRGHETYFVGGCVRDLLLARRPKDFDVATDARPEELKRIFGRRCRIIGRRFRLAHVYIGSQIYEIATFRGLPDDQEVAGDDSGFVVRANTFGTAFEDARSRDFTVNGLFYDPLGDKVIDHVGGLADIERRLLRTIGDADKRLREDPVRLLRAIKFASRLGFGIDQPILEAAPATSPLIASCPPARVAEELYRMSESGHARSAWTWMQGLGVLAALLPELSSYVGDGPELPEPIANWLAELDRMTRAHGTLPREATFALIAWPFVELELERRSDVARIAWGRFALEGVRELAVRLSVPIRHRYTLAGMADVLKRLRQTPVRRPQQHHLKSYGVPLALTAQRMTFLLTGEGREAYDAWATELERLGLWAAPFEPRHEDDEDLGEPDALALTHSSRRRRTHAGQAPRPVDDPPHDDRVLDELDVPVPVVKEADAADRAGAPESRGRRRRRRPRRGGGKHPAPSED